MVELCCTHIEIFTELQAFMRAYKQPYDIRTLAKKKTPTFGIVVFCRKLETMLRLLNGQLTCIDTMGCTVQGKHP